MTFDLTRLSACGRDVVVSELAEIRRPHLVSIGHHSAIDSFTSISTAAEIGDYVHIGPGASVIGGVEGMLRMGHFTNLAAGVRIICGTDRYLGAGLIGSGALPPRYRDEMQTAPVVIEQFANVGTNAIVMPGITLAIGSVVGAGSLVRESTAPWTIYVGVPARPLKTRACEKMIAYARELGY